MGIKTPNTKATLAFLTTVFSIGFCSNLSTVLYSISTTYHNRIGTLPTSLSPTSLPSPLAPYFLGHSVAASMLGVESLASLVS